MNIVKLTKVYKANTCTGLGNDVPVEPWLHLIYVKSLHALIVFVWDTREVVYEDMHAEYVESAMKHHMPGTWLKANDNGLPLKHCKTEAAYTNELQTKLKFLQTVKQLFEQNKAEDARKMLYRWSYYERGHYVDLQDVQRDIDDIVNKLQ